MWEEASVGTGGPAGGRCRGAGWGLKFTITSHRGQTPGLTKGGNQCEGLVSLHSAGGWWRGPGSSAPSSTTTVTTLG